MPLYSPSGHAMRYLYIVQRSFAHSTPGMTSISNVSHTYQCGMGFSGMYSPVYTYMLTPWLPKYPSL